MADQKNKNYRNISKRINNLNNQMNDLYQTTYRTRTDNRDDMKNIIGSIDNNIDDLLSKINNRSTSDISSLYIRLQRKSGGVMDNINNSIEELFNNQTLLNTLDVENMSKSIQAEDYQYDLICKYMTKLEEALEIKRDNVLSSDNFTKDFINVISDKSSKEYLQEFNDRATFLKDKYKIQELFEEIYDDTSKYGEYFLYHVPYDVALKRLVKRKSQMGGAGYMDRIRYESNVDDYKSGEPIFESAQLSDKYKSSLNSEFISQLSEGKSSVYLTFDKSNMISSVVRYVEEREKIKNKPNSLITEGYILREASNNPNSSSDIHLKQSNHDLIAPDGFVNSDRKMKSEADKIKTISGSVLTKLDRSQVFPICLGDDVCLGYIYLEVKNSYIDNLVMNGKTYNSLTNPSSMDAAEYDKQNDILIAQIAAQMSDAIDAQFINNNIDLKDQIYAILRFNDHFCVTQGINNINISFLAVEDVQHIYFKKDKKTHRGISDLKKSIIPAMLYCLLYLTDVIGKISREQDKRIYYVKQNIETNVAKTLLNVIDQIKKGNMGMRQLESMNSIFNVIGKYNDHIIPVGQNGDSPIQFEVMPGQKQDTPTELLDRLEDQAISCTDVPLEFIQSTNNVDFATRFTMSNSKFLRKVFKRQGICQNIFSKIFTNLYNFEYDENEQNIKILLPAPAFLTLTNSSQLIDNTKNYASAIADIMFGDDQSEEKQEFIRLLIRKHLGTYIDFDNIDEMMVEAQHLLSYKKSQTVDDNSSGDEY